jgi:hypothetical protein
MSLRFEGCKIKYNKMYDKNVSIRIKHPSWNYTLDCPINEDNRDYRAVLEWVAAGNTIQEAD